MPKTPSEDELAIDILTHMESDEAAHSQAAACPFGSAHARRAQALRRGARVLEFKAVLVKALRLAIIDQDVRYRDGDLGARSLLKRLRGALKRAGEAP